MLPSLVKQAKARAYDVKKALDGLLEASRVTRIGKSRATRYALPTWSPPPDDAEGD